MTGLLKSDGFVWHRLRYHRSPSLPATLFDITVGAALSLWLCFRHDVEIVHARSHVPGAMCIVPKAILGTKILFDMRGLLAEEYADAGHWRAHGLKYRLVKTLERHLLSRADAIVMLTESIRKDLVACSPLARAPHRVEVIPCCVDVRRFDPSRREVARKRLGWLDDRVVVYAGKAGTWYMPDEMAEFFATLRRRDRRWLMAVFTQSHTRPFEAARAKASVPRDRWTVRQLPPQDIPDALIAADVGLCFIRPSYSKRASSPTKLGEYLAAGLPVVVNAGVGDVESLVEDARVGVVTRAFSRAEYERACDGLEQLVTDTTHRLRSRRVAVEHLGLETVGGPAYRRVYGQLSRLSAGERQ